jgi:serine phosphatase RsbU (regulator of sigma subunit)
VWRETDTPKPTPRKSPLRDAIVADVRQYRAGALPNDDLTIVLLKRT